MKLKYIIFLFLALMMFSGCSKEQSFECKIDLTNNVDNYKFIANYKIYYKNSYVTRIDKEETYKSKDEKVINYFLEYKDTEYSSFNYNYGGYEYQIENNINKLTIVSQIDLSKINIKKMVFDKYIEKEYTSANHLTVNGIKYIYTKKGAKCSI